MPQFHGLCSSQFNNIDQNHIDATNKTICVSTNAEEIRRIWNNRQGNPLSENGVIIHIRGRSNWSHIIDRRATFNVCITTSRNGECRFVLQNVKID